MPRSHLFVQSVSESRDDTYRRLAEDARSGASVTLYLCEEAVHSARRDRSRALEQALASGVEVLVDRRSLRARGLRASSLVPGARTAGIDVLTHRIQSGERATWL